MSAPEFDNTWTVRRLISQLQLQDPEDEVLIGDGRFTIYRVKDRSGVTVIEINEIEGTDYTILERE